jgi:hypothetical protein
MSENPYRLFSKKGLYKLRQWANEELRRRAEYRDSFKDRLDGAMQGMANVMACAAKAMELRMVLRWAHNHNPIGTRPQHGAVWTVPEIIYAYNLFNESFGRACTLMNPFKWSDTYCTEFVCNLINKNVTVVQPVRELSF